MVDVYLANNTVDEQAATAHNGSMRSEHIKAFELESTGQTYVPNKTFKKSHQRRFETENFQNIYVRYTDLLLLKQKLLDHPDIPPPTMLLDSGAALSFINYVFVRLRKFRPAPLKNELRIVMADATSVVPYGTSVAVLHITTRYDTWILSRC